MRLFPLLRFSSLVRVQILDLDGDLELVALAPVGAIRAMLEEADRLLHRRVLKQARDRGLGQREVGVLSVRAVDLDLDLHVTLQGLALRRDEHLEQADTALGKFAVAGLLLGFRHERSDPIGRAVLVVVDSDDRAGQLAAPARARPSDR